MQYDKGMNKAYSALTVKSFDEAEGIFIGVASTPAPDRTKDIVEPKGAVFNLPIPLLAFHNHEKVIGTVEQATVTDSGIEVVCRVLKDLTNEAREIWSLIQAGALKGLSIGFKSLENEPLANGGFKFSSWEWLELSVVPVPMNAQASITTTKSAVQPIEVSNSMTISEQIQQFQAKRAAVLASMDTLITKGATLTGDDEVQFKSAEAELVTLDQHIERLKAAEGRQAKNAQPIIVGHVPHVTIADNAPKGRDFVRFTKSIALAGGNLPQALEIAKGMGFSDRVQTTLKAAVAAGTSDSVAYGPLVEQTTMASEFIELLIPATIVGRLSALRRVPMDIRIPKQTGATSASWVGEAKPAPLTGAAFSDMTVEHHKVAAIVALSEELMRSSDPSAEALITADLIKGAARAIDLAFSDVTNAGVLGIKPASVFNGTANTAVATGVTADHVRADVANVFGYALNADQPLDGAAWLMHPATALQLSMMRHATSGQPEFPGVDMAGGTFFGLPVITSTNVAGSAVLGYPVSLIVQPEILIAEGGLAVSVGREVSLEMDSAPVGDGKTPTPAELVSMWQNGLVAVKATRPITWKPRRPSAVAQITACKYAA